MHGVFGGSEQTRSELVGAAHPESELVERRDRRLEVGRTERHQSELVQPRSEAQCDSWRIAHPESVSVWDISVIDTGHLFSRVAQAPGANSLLLFDPMRVPVAEHIISMPSMFDAMLRTP